jgi:dTDP-4-amino-4,6-dideoxygalactose transaminase
VGPGDEVIVPANTYIATAIAVSQCGASPVFVDVADTYLMTAEAVEAALTARTKAIVPVHLFGALAPMDALLDLARRHGLQVIEDACQAHGARKAGRRAGSFGRAAAFSFYPGKNLGACGDAGAVVTDDETLAQAVKLLRDFGQRRKYDHRIKGGNERLDTLQAAILRVKLPMLDAWNARRIEAAARYDALFSGSGVSVPPRARDGSDVFHLYVVEVDGRDEVREHLAAGGIESGIHYPIPIPRQAAYAELGLRPGAFPVTEAAAGRLLSLPMFPEISEDQITRVASAVAIAQRGAMVSA